MLHARSQFGELAPIFFRTIITAANHSHDYENRPKEIWRIFRDLKFIGQLPQLRDEASSRLGMPQIPASRLSSVPVFLSFFFFFLAVHDPIQRFTGLISLPGLDPVTFLNQRGLPSARMAETQKHTMPSQPQRTRKFFEGVSSFAESTFVFSSDSLSSHTRRCRTPHHNNHTQRAHKDRTKICWRDEALGRKTHVISQDARRVRVCRR